MEEISRNLKALGQVYRDVFGAHFRRWRGAGSAVVEKAGAG